MESWFIGRVIMVPFLCVPLLNEARKLRFLDVRGLATTCCCTPLTLKPVKDGCMFEISAYSELSCALCRVDSSCHLWDMLNCFSRPQIAWQTSVKFEWNRAKTYSIAISIDLTKFVWLLERARLPSFLRQSRHQPRGERGGVQIVVIALLTTSWNPDFHEGDYLKTDLNSSMGLVYLIKLWLFLKDVRSSLDLFDVMPFPHLQKPWKPITVNYGISILGYENNSSYHVNMLDEKRVSIQ